MDEITRKPLCFEHFVLDGARRTLCAADRAIDLRPKSFDVLLYLVEHAGRIVGKDEIMDAVWGDVTVTDESLTRCVSDVRYALGDTEQRIIKTVPRRGYLFAMPVTSIRPTAGHVQHSVAVSADASAPPGQAEHFQWARSPRWWAAVALFFAVGITCLFYFKSAQKTAIFDRPSVAVVPFVTANADPDYFGDGLAEDIATNLSRFGELLVIAQHSAARFKGQPFDAARIGADLGARYLLTGSVRRDGGRVRIAAQLVESASGKQLWAENYDRDLSDLFSVQDEVAQHIVRNLAPRLKHSEFDRVLRQRPGSMIAYDYVLRANALTRGRPGDMERIVEAKELYEEALADDPHYARALEGLAYTYFLMWALEQSPDYQRRSVLDQALALARRAVDLDGSRAEAHAVLGWVLNFQDRTREGVAEFERGFSINPNFVDGRYGMLLAHVGRGPEAIDYMKRAMRVDPFHPPTYVYWLGKAYYFSGDEEQAIKFIREGAERMPGFLPPRVLLAAVTARLGLDEEARRAALEIMELRPGFTVTDWIKFLRIVDESYAARLRQDLHKASLPE